MAISMATDNIDNIDNNRNFDINKFNKIFDEEKEAEKELIKQNSESRLAVLNNQDNKQTSKELYDMTILDVLSGLKTTWFGIADDLLYGNIENISFDIFYKETRLTYIGLTVIIFVTLIYLLNAVIETIKFSN